MNRIFAAALISTTLAAPAQAGWFSADPSCAAADVACLKELALATIVQDVQDSEPRNQSGPGRRYGQLEQLLDTTELEAARATILAASPSDDFWAIYDRDAAERQGRKAMNYQGILDAVEGRGYPKDMKWGDLISGAIIATINGPDAEKLVDLYLSEPDFFGDYAERASVPIISHMAQINIAALEDFAANPDMPKATLTRSLTPLGLRAELACLDGDVALGKRIMALRDGLAETQIYDAELAFLPLVRRFPYILACEGEEAALAELAKIETGLDAIPTGKTITYRGLKMSVDGMRNRDVMDYVALPLAYHFHDTGRSDDAKALFGRFKAPSMQLTFDAEGNPVTFEDGADHPLFDAYTDAQKDELRANMAQRMGSEWDSALERRAEGERYAEKLATRLDYFINRFDPQFKICCSDGQGVEAMIEDIVEASASGPVSPKALPRVLELIARAEAKDKYVGISSGAVTTLRLSMAEKPVGCALPEDRLGDLLVDIEEIEDIGARTTAILELIKYQQTPLGPRGDTPCVVQ